MRAGVHLDNGGYMLAPPDDGFVVQFLSSGSDMVGVIQGFLVDPAAFGHPVTLGWRATGAPGQPIHPDEDRDDLEFFWTEFPVAELSVNRRLDTSAAAAPRARRFPSSGRFTTGRACRSCCTRITPSATRSAPS
jgi:hypothetical protein